MRPLPSSIGRYVLLRRLPESITGESYLAIDAEVGLVDVHLLAANDATRDVVLLLAQLGHPNVARMRDAGMVEGDIYVAEDHVEGVPLAELLAHGYLSGDVTLHVLAAVASSLAEAEQVLAGQQPLALAMGVRVPDTSEIFVSSVGQVRLSLLSVMALPSALDTVLEIEGTMAAAAAAHSAGRPAARRQLPVRDPAAGIGALVERLLGPQRDRQDEAAVAARQLAELAQEGAGRPGDCRALHALAITALRQVTSATGFVSSKLADLVEHFAPLSGTDEIEWAQRGALLVEALPEDVPQAGAVQSWYHSATTPGGARAAASGASPPWRTSALAPAGSHQIGQELLGTPYRLLRKLGVGGMGLVFEAEHVDLGRRVAIKVLHGALNRDPQVLARFRQEARSAARIRHPHIVEIYDFGSTAAGEVFLVMELLEGQNLTRLCRDGLLPVDRAVELLRQAAEGVEAAHQSGVIHRDLKPDNIMVVPRNRPTGARWPDLVKVLDFGIAKLRAADHTGAGQPSITRQGQLFGTPEYMAPEQILGVPTDHRVDIYALGCIAYEVLCGALPYGGDSYGQILAAHLKDVPQPLYQRVPERRIPAVLDQIVLRAIAKEPEERFASMADLADALGDVLAGTSALPGPPRATPSGLSLRSAPAVVLSEPAQPTEPAASLSEGVRQRPRSIWHKHWLWGSMGALLGLLGVSLWIRYQQVPSGDEGAASHAGAGPLSMPHRGPSAGPAQPPAQSFQNAAVVPSAPAPAPPLSTAAAAPEPLPVPISERVLPISSQQPVPQANREARSAAAADPVGPAGKPGGHLAVKLPLHPPAEERVAAEGPSGAGRTVTEPVASIGPLLAVQPPALLAAQPVQGPQGVDPSPVDPSPTAQDGSALPSAQPDKAQPDKAPPDKPDKAQPDKAPAPAPAPAPVRFTSGKLSYTVASTTSAYGRRDVIAGLDSHRQALDACYQQSVRAAPLLPPRGAGSLSFAIDEDGLVSGRVRTDGAAQGIGECVEQVLRRTRFPRPEIGPAQVTVVVSLDPISQ